MGIRDQIAKVFGNRVPAEMQAGEQAAQMTPDSPFSPGQPIGPYDGFSRQPRSQNFVTGYNIAARPKSHERVSFETLRGLVEAYDVAQMCIWHRIDSIRALDWSLVPARGFKGNADEAISRGMAVLEKPDRQTPFANWLAKWLYDVLAYDAGTLYRLRNRGGRVIGLRPVDGTTIAPLLDYWGQIPEAPTEGFVQYVNGLPWNWLTRDDLIYQPFRPRTNSPYGVAPLETILLNANTDLRFQKYFLERFTQGNIPEAFASAPESWTPEQIETFQGYWDQLLLGDQAAKHQIKWMPGGSGITWSNERDFSDAFSLFLMRKTCAAYHIVPADLGFTENVNRSSGETQADVQHRVGDLPLIAYIQGVLTHFLRHDLGLPVEFSFDTGQEKEDRLTLAQAWQIYIESGMASPDEGREELLGLPSDPQRPTPRFFSTSRLGPVPLLAIDGVAGRVDTETYGPAADQPVLWQPFVPPPGVVPAPGTTDAKASLAAEDTYQSQVRHQLEAETGKPPAPAPEPVTKDGASAAAAAPTVGVTAETGITSYDLIGQHDDEEDNDGPVDERVQAAKAETIAFRRFAKARRRDGKWRDFSFQHVDPRQARRMNQAGRLTVRKLAGEIAVAGLVVQAADTGRVLMLQRALMPDDPAGGTWEFPGGHLEGEETPVAGAVREWSEETGFILPFDPQGISALAFAPPGWTSGPYAGFVYTIPSESMLDLSRRDQVTNPDDPDGDVLEALAWWEPTQLLDNPALRPELLASLDAVLTALGTAEEVAKAGDDDPKGDGPDWPGWDHDERTALHWGAILAAAAATALTHARAEQLAREYAAFQGQDTSGQSKTERVDACVAWLAAQGLDLVTPLIGPFTGILTDAFAIGTAAAAALVDGGRMQLGGWEPGDDEGARHVIDTLGVAGLAGVLGKAREAAEEFAAGRLRDIARALVDGIASGADWATIASAMTAVSIQRVLGAITTWITRISGWGASLLYRKRDIQRGRWLTEQDGRTCPVCSGNEDFGPLPIGAAYPSGDIYPPAHPNCRCALIPD